MKKKRLLSSIMAGIIGLSVLSGCAEEKKETSEGVKLKWIMAGQGMQQDSLKVWEVFNNKLQDYLPGVTVEFDPVTFSDFSEKWQLMCAAGEKADLVWTGFAFKIPDQITKGAYMPIGDLLDKYAGELKKEIPEWAWELGSYNGEIYVMPIMQQYAAKSALMAPKELVDKYMDKEKIENGTEEQDIVNEIDKYLAGLKSDEKIGKGIYPQYVYGSIYSATSDVFWDTPTTGISCCKNDDGSFKVVTACESESTKLKYKKMAEWYEKGYILSDILTIKDMDSYIGKPDGIVLTTTQVLEGEAERKSAQYGMDVDLINVGKTPYRLSAGACKTGIAIPKTSEHPKEAIELLQLLNTEKGKELLNILIYGIEGEHYETVGENRIKTFDYSGSSPKSNSKYGVDKWAVGNTYYSYETTDNPEGWNTYIRSVNEEASANVSPIMGFTFNQEPVSLELVQTNAVISQYNPVLVNGAKGADWESYYNEYVEKMKKAGIETIRAEVEKQLNEWVNQKNSK